MIVATTTSRGICGTPELVFLKPGVLSLSFRGLDTRALGIGTAVPTASKYWIRDASISDADNSCFWFCISTTLLTATWNLPSITFSVTSAFRSDGGFGTKNLIPDVLAAEPAGVSSGIIIAGTGVATFVGPILVTAFVLASGAEFDTAGFFTTSIGTLESFGSFVLLVFMLFGEMFCGSFFSGSGTTIAFFGIRRGGALL
mmetsp:Transcript_23368/g.36067  ORF Transcript_23368/g.36067 Transcript_23368/m.36067 type:complete len:200 (+) Transcript_23368:1573-2172(+)